MLSFRDRVLAPAPVLLKGLAFVAVSALLLAMLCGLAGYEGAVLRINIGVAILLAVVLVLMVIDARLALRQPLLRVERDCARSMAVERWSEVRLTLHHDFAEPRTVAIYDGLTRSVECENMPAEVQLLPGKKSTLSYRIKARERGPLHLQQAYLRVPSPLGLWHSHYRVAEETQLKVYPDFAAIDAFTILATDHHESQIGIKRKPRRGEGLEFLQLRDYRNGDSLRQVDWKATSRRQKIISREYQDERDQNVVLLIDSGRRMRAKDDGLSHFDHSLNALLLVSYIALRQGDSVSVMSFGRQQRWVSAKKGVGAMKTILNEMYDLHAGNYASDYIAAAEALAVMQRKRSLVILVTNARDENVEDLVMATQVLRKRHIVLVANIREAVLDQMQEGEIVTLDDALQYAGVHQYLHSRQSMHQRIAGGGVLAVECLAHQLAARVANSYLEIKRAGLL